jgi:DNA (cytosine-5)-methyltransferase 1
MRRRPRVLSVFTGAGGLDVGLQAAGFRTLACIELDPQARETLRQNRPSWRLIEPGDVNEVAKSFRAAHIGLKRRELECIAAGVPCQPYSKAAQWAASGRTGLKDPRSRCLRSLMRLVDACLPRVLLIENVEGFVRGEGSALRSIQSSLGRINSRHGTKYKVRWTVLDAADFGVPQHRRRSILLAFREGSEFDWPTPTHRGVPVTAWDAIGDLRPRNPPPAKGRWAALLPAIPEGGNYLHLTPKGGGTPVFGYRRRYWSFLLKLAKDRPSWTVAANPAQNAGPFHWDNRRLTTRELLRLQSFPKGWKLSGLEATQVRQVGNATPPLLAEVVGRALAEQAFGQVAVMRPALSVRRRRHVPRPSRTGSVPPQYLSSACDLRTHPGCGLGPGRNHSWAPELTRLETPQSSPGFGRGPSSEYPK